MPCLVLCGMYLVTSNKTTESIQFQHARLMNEFYVLVGRPGIVNVIVLCPETSNWHHSRLCFYISTPHPVCRIAASMAGKVTHVNYTLFPTAPRILESRRYFLYFFLTWTLDNTCCPNHNHRQFFLK